MDANPNSAPPVVMREMDAAERERLNALIEEEIGAVYVDWKRIVRDF